MHVATVWTGQMVPSVDAEREIQFTAITAMCGRFCKEWLEEMDIKNIQIDLLIEFLDNDFRGPL